MREKRDRKRAKNTQAALNQPIERARVHGSEKCVSSDVVEAVAKFDAIRPSRWCTRCRCTWPSSWFGSAPTTRSEGGRLQLTFESVCCRVPRRVSALGYSSVWGRGGRGQGTRLTHFYRCGLDSLESRIYRYYINDASIVFLSIIEFDIY
jgi:hypothetical protein